MKSNPCSRQCKQLFGAPQHSSDKILERVRRRTRSPGSAFAHQGIGVTCVDSTPARAGDCGDAAQNRTSSTGCARETFRSGASWPRCAVLRRRVLRVGHGEDAPLARLQPHRLIVHAPVEHIAVAGFVEQVGRAFGLGDPGAEPAGLRGNVIKVPCVLNLATILSARATPKWLLRRVSGAIVRRIRVPSCCALRNSPLGRPGGLMG